MNAIRTVVRWLLVPISAAAVVGACVLCARWAVTIADRRCAADSMVGGACVEPWHTGVVEAAIYAAVAVAVFGLVILPAMIAPQLKRTTALLLFAVSIGVLASGYVMTGWTEILRPLAVAVVTGAVALWWVWSRRRTA